MKKILHDITDNERLEEEQYRRQLLSAHGFSSIDIQEQIFRMSQEDKKECKQSMAAWKKREEQEKRNVVEKNIKKIPKILELK